MVNIVVEWKQVLNGFLVTLVLSVTFGLAAGTYVAYLGVLIAGVLSGYLIGVKSSDKILNGALMGLIAGLIMAIVAVIITSYSQGLSNISIVPIGIDSILYLIVFYGILATIGGIIGVMVKEPI